jgi:hypothetical protein
MDWKAKQFKIFGCNKTKEPEQYARGFIISGY